MCNQTSILSDTLLKIINSGKHFLRIRRSLAMRQNLKYLEVTSIKTTDFLLRINFVSSSYHKPMLLRSLWQTLFCCNVWSVTLYVEIIWGKWEIKTQKIFFSLFLFRTPKHVVLNSPTKLYWLACFPCEFIEVCKNGAGSYVSWHISWGRAQN